MTLVLTVLGYIVGGYSERKHYRSIIQREKRFLALPTITNSEPMGIQGNIRKVVLAQGNVVISIDYFKRILAGLRNFFGGEVQAYETLLDRARREAVLRLKEGCPGADQIINLRIETASISKGERNTVGSVELFAYGTAIYVEHD